MAQIYALRDDGTAEVLTRVRCKGEDRELQQLLEKNHDLLPGDQIDPDDPCRWLLVKREMPVPDPATGTDRWSIDFFFVDQGATPTFVECKRFEDTRSRREVVGQMLEYAANGHHYWTKEQIRDLAEATARQRGLELDAALEALQPTDDLSVDSFFERVQENLRQGQLRIVFFLEEAPPELRSVVDFLNNQMERSEVLLVEARQYVSDGRRLVAPALFGYTEQARLAKIRVKVSTPSARRRWDEESFLGDAAKKLQAHDVQALRLLYDAAQDLRCELAWGTGKGNGSFSIKDPSLCQRSFVSAYSNGALSLNFGWLNDSPRAETIRDRFIQLAVERLGLPQEDYRQKLVTLAVASWSPKSKIVVGLLSQVLSEFRPGAA